MRLRNLSAPALPRLNSRNLRHKLHTAPLSVQSKLRPSANSKRKKSTSCLQRQIGWRLRSPSLQQRQRAKPPKREAALEEEQKGKKPCCKRGQREIPNSTYGHEVLSIRRGSLSDMLTDPTYHHDWCLWPCWISFRYVRYATCPRGGYMTLS